MQGITSMREQVSGLLSNVWGMGARNETTLVHVYRGHMHSRLRNFSSCLIGFSLHN